MRKTGVKFNRSLLKRLTVNMKMTSVHDAYNYSTIDTRTMLLIANCISSRWIQSFSEANGIGQRSKTRKLMVSAEKKERIRRAVAFHLRTV